MSNRFVVRCVSDLYANDQFENNQRNPESNKMGHFEQIDLIMINFVKKETMSLLKRITIDPEVCHGKPCVRGMRWPVEVVIDLLGSGMSIEKIIEDHPELEKEDILACLNYAKVYMSGISIKDVA